MSIKTATLVFVSGVSLGSIVNVIRAMKESYVKMKSMNANQIHVKMVVYALIC